MTIIPRGVVKQFQVMTSGVVIYMLQEEHRFWIINVVLNNTMKRILRLSKGGTKIDDVIATSLLAI